jgi:hypothetical protein
MGYRLSVDGDSSQLKDFYRADFSNLGSEQSQLPSRLRQ